MAAVGRRAERPSSDVYKPVYAQYDTSLNKWVRCEAGSASRQFSRFHLYYLENPAAIPQDAAAAANMAKHQHLASVFANWSKSLVADQTSALTVIYEWACFEDFILRYGQTS